MFCQMVKSINRLLSGVILILILLILGMYTARFMGINPSIVRSGSMEPEILTGSLCMVHTKHEFDEIEVGDVIAFEVGKSLVTHRVTAITTDGLITKGDNNEISDGLTTTKENYLGKNIVSIPYLGYVFSFLQTSKGKVVSVTFILTCIVVQMLAESVKN